MNKRGLCALAAAIAFLSAGSLNAAEKKGAAGGLEVSGNVDVVTGWQHDTSNAGGSISLINAADSAGSGEGQLGDFRGIGTPNRDTFNFYIDQVELDFSKAFGENIRIRADLDFGRLLSGSGRNTAGTNFQLEQGYVTANIPVGNGVEFLIGRFNTPIGLEAVDRADNLALSFSNLFRYLRPHNTTGAKIYYAFNDSFDFHLYVVNNLVDTIGNDTPIPSYGARFGFTWGEKGKENVIGLSYAGGPEAAALGGNQMAHLTHIGDLDFSLHLGDSFVIAGEGMFRQDNLGGACHVGGPAAGGANAGKNCKALSGQLLLGYNFNETWGGWFRYGYLHDFQGNYTTIDQQIHDFTIGGSYQVTEGAKIKLEYRLDLALPAGPIGTAFNHGVGLEFAYNF